MEAGTKVYVVCWGDKKAKTIVSTAGTLVPGTHSIRSRHRVVVVAGVKTTERYFKVVPRPKMLEDMYSTFGKVDQHNFLRQVLFSPTLQYYIDISITADVYADGSGPLAWSATGTLTTGRLGFSAQS